MVMLISKNDNVKLREGSVEHLGVEADSGGDFFEANWSVPNTVQGGHIRQQVLGCANIAGGLISANVLLTGLQGHTVS